MAKTVDKKPDKILVDGCIEVYEEERVVFIDPSINELTGVNQAMVDGYTSNHYTITRTRPQKKVRKVPAAVSRNASWFLERCDSEEDKDMFRETQKRDGFPAAKNWFYEKYPSLDDRKKSAKK